MNENLSLKAKIYHYAVLFLVFLFLALPLMATFLYSISTSWGVSVLPDDLTEWNSGADSQRMAGEPPSRKESGLHSRDRIEQAHRLQVVEVGHT